MKTLYDTAMRVLAARDALLLAQANLKAATSAYYESCDRSKFEHDDEELQMFLFAGEDRVWKYAPEYREQFPLATQLHISANPIFKELCAAYEAKRKARTTERAARRRLLSIGVKRCGN